MVVLEVIKKGYTEFITGSDNVKRYLIHRTEVRCECGTNCYLENVKNHFKTQKHIKFMNQIKIL